MTPRGVAVKQMCGSTTPASSDEAKNRPLNLHLPSAEVEPLRQVQQTNLRRLRHFFSIRSLTTRSANLGGKNRCPSGQPPNPSPSRPGGFHPEALTEPCVTVSRHTARAIHGRLPPSITTSRFLLLPVDQVGRFSPPSKPIPERSPGDATAPPPVQAHPSMRKCWPSLRCGPALPHALRVPAQRADS